MIRNEGISTGFYDLDFGMRGLVKGEVTLVSGDVSSYKSTLLQNIFLNIAKNKELVTYISLDMPVDLMLERCINNLEGIKNYNDKAVQEYFNDCIIEDELFIFKDLIGYLESNCTESKIIIIDGIDLINTGYHSREFDFENILMFLKFFARKHEIPILISTSLTKDISNRGDKRPILSDLSKYKCLTTMTDNIIFTWSEYDIDPENIDEKDILTVYLAKSKNNKTDKLYKLIHFKEFNSLVNKEKGKNGDL